MDEIKKMVIGLTGAFGSGTSFLATHFFVDAMEFTKYSLSQILKNELKERNKQNAKDSKLSQRNVLQNFGNKLREKDSAYLAKKVVEQIQNEPYQSDKIVIDSIRNPAEIKYLRETFPDFILIGVFADYEVRWERVKEAYDYKKDSFDLDDKKDKGNLEPEHGQKISDCFFEADLIISNNDFISYKYDNEKKIDERNDKYHAMYSKLTGYLYSYLDPVHSSPTLMETLMAAAYTSGRRSRCLKRRVGAVITDKFDRIISSGFNGVPVGLKECKSLFGSCYRDKKRGELSIKLLTEMNCLNNSDISQATDAVKRNVKLLDLCRALHAEENALMNLVGRGVNLENSTIYVTTYPCAMCANKIVQSNIERVIYFEPYPVEEAKIIFKNKGIYTEAFEGVTFRAFFRFFQYEP